jgi:peptidoglycan/LPS O-acetylase OafA/YrhL
LWIVLIPAISIGLMIDDVGMRLFGSAGGIYSFPSGQDYVTPVKFSEGHDLSTIIGNVFFLQTIFVPPLGTNVALWSLSNEFWYYLAFPLILLALRREIALARRLVYGGLAVIILLLIGVHASYLFLIWVMGAAIAALKPVIPANKASLAVLATAILAFVIVLFAKKLHLPLALAELLVGATAAALVYAIKCQTGQSKAVLYNKSAKFFSDISYTLYLTHLPFLVLLCAMVNSPWSQWPLSVVTALKFCLIIATAILWATLMHRLFEAKTDLARNFVMRQLGKARSGVAATGG